MKKINSLIIFFLATVLFFSCVGGRKKPGVGFAQYLAFRDEMTSPQEAVVWTLAADGRVSTFWVKNDVTGVVAVAAREDWVLPTENGLWRLENDDEDKDYNFVEFRNLLTDEVLALPLDEAFDGADAGIEDGGVGPAGECAIHTVQGKPAPLISVGSYVFLKYEETTYNCEETATLTEDKYVTIDLSHGEEIDILTEKERKALFARKDVRILAKQGDVRLVGSIPSYNPAFALTFVHVFSTVHTEVLGNGEGHSVVDILEVPDASVPDKLKRYYVPPELVQAFGISIPAAVLGGFVAIGGSPETVLRQFAAFTDTPYQVQQTDIN